MSPTTFSQAPQAGRKLLHGHVPKEVVQLLPLGRLPASTNLQLAIGLHLLSTILQIAVIGLFVA